MSKSAFKINKSSFELNKLITTSRMFSKIKLSISAKLVLRCIIDFWNNKLGYAYPTQKTISTCTGLSNVSVFQAVKELEQSGLVKKNKKYKRLRYEFTVKLWEYLNLAIDNFDVSSGKNLQNNTEKLTDNNILINKENRDMTKEEMAKIVIQNLGNNPIFKQKIDELKEKIKQ